MSVYKRMNGVRAEKNARPYENLRLLFFVVLHVQYAKNVRCRSWGRRIGDCRAVAGRHRRKDNRHNIRRAVARDVCQYGARYTAVTSSPTGCVCRSVSTALAVALSADVYAGRVA